MIKCAMRVADVEALLGVTLYDFAHRDGMGDNEGNVTKTNVNSENKIIVRTLDAITLPSEISAHIDIVSGISEFPKVCRNITRNILKHQRNKIRK